MTARRNPFEYAAANDLPPEMVLDYYIEDFNYSRFINSKRNVLLVGERGAGKSMALLYNSWHVKRLKAERSNSEPALEHVGVYVPCNTPLTHKLEYQLLGKVGATVLSEHFLVLAITYAIAETLGDVAEAIQGIDDAGLRSRIEYVLGETLPRDMPLFEALKAFVNKQILQTQRAINNAGDLETRYDHTFTFASLVVPVLGLTRNIPRLKSSHFLLLIDDAHDLNEYQMRALNSWIAYRDHSLFSFKVAVASTSRTSLKTSAGGSILENHDFTKLDMVQVFQNPASDFGHLASRLVSRRLTRFDIDATPQIFFPMSDRLQQDLDKARAAVRQEAVEKYGEGDSRKVADHIYKYARARYFRSRSPRANRPEYSGFDTLVFLSTGVVRNLLIPCYWMYDKMLSLVSESDGEAKVINSIPPGVQTEIILERSRALWDLLRLGLDQNIEGCSRDDARRCYRLLDNLALYFRQRLLEHKSEPRANSFTVSGWTDDLRGRLTHLFEILCQAQLLYIRSGPAKENGKREFYYVPNRLLWPERGLDPHGQHARVSIGALALWQAADQNKQIPFGEDSAHDEPTLFG